MSRKVLSQTEWHILGLIVAGVSGALVGFIVGVGFTYQWVCG